VTYTETSTCQRFINFELQHKLSRPANLALEEYLNTLARDQDACILYHKLTDSHSTPSNGGSGYFAAFMGSQRSIVGGVQETMNPEEHAMTLMIIFDPTRCQRLQSARQNLVGLDLASAGKERMVKIDEGDM
jgi:hypothetical protein